MKRSYRFIFNLFALCVLLATLIGSAVFVTPVHAAGIVVNSSADTIANDGLCTLREAITAANTDAPYNGCPAGSGADTITFAGNYTITLESQLPLVTSVITINGNGTANSSLSVGGGSGFFRLIEVSATGNLTLNQISVSNGACYSIFSCSGYGGNIYNDGTLTVTNSTIGSGIADRGAGIFNNRTLTVANSDFSLNNAKYYGGGIYNEYFATMTVTNSNFTYNFAAENAGGAISSGGTLTITNSTFAYNYAGYWGGGINNDGNLIVTNSTFSGNEGTSYGGGINNNGVVSILSSTFSGNRSGIAGGVIRGTATFKNSILANSLGSENCSGVISNGGNNLDSGVTCGWGSANASISNVDAKLGPLANHGGATQTHSLLTGSPAIDRGTDAGCPGTDQRGAQRPRGAHCDMGAYEITFPATPSFADVPVDYLYYQDIEILYVNGLTGGCSTSPLKFCPGDLMNRGQAAVFMMRGTYGASYVPPANLVYKFNKDDWSKGT